MEYKPNDTESSYLSGTVIKNYKQAKYFKKIKKQKLIDFIVDATISVVLTLTTSHFAFNAIQEAVDVANLGKQISANEQEIVRLYEADRQDEAYKLETENKSLNKEKSIGIAASVITSLSVLCFMYLIPKHYVKNANKSYQNYIDEAVKFNAKAKEFKASFYQNLYEDVASGFIASGSMEGKEFDEASEDKKVEFLFDYLTKNGNSEAGGENQEVLEVLSNLGGVFYKFLEQNLGNPQKYFELSSKDKSIVVEQFMQSELQKLGEEESERRMFSFYHQF